MNLWDKLSKKYDYDNLLVPEYKDLIIYIPTRSNPIGLIKTLSMMRETCDSISNFDVLVIVDEDQIKMYEEEKDRYVRGPVEKDEEDFIADYGEYELYGNSLFDNVTWTSSKHNTEDWWNIFNIRNEFLKENDYYFDALWTDDFVGLSQSWDSNIVSKKHYFKDDLFTLHQSEDGGGQKRLLHAYENCYVKEKLTIDTKGYKLSQHDYIWKYSESLPVTTRKLSLMVNEVIKPNYLTSQFEMLIAAVIMILYKEYGHNRLVNGDFSWEQFLDEPRRNRVPSKKIGTDGFKTKKMSFDDWTRKKDYIVIRPIVEEIDRIIKEK